MKQFFTVLLEDQYGNTLKKYNIEHANDPSPKTFWFRIPFANVGTSVREIRNELKDCKNISFYLKDGSSLIQKCELDGHAIEYIGDSVYRHSLQVCVSFADLYYKVLLGKH